jgi:hypothetical protein
MFQRTQSRTKAAIILSRTMFWFSLFRGWCWYIHTKSLQENDVWMYCLTIVSCKRCAMKTKHKFEVGGENSISNHVSCIVSEKSLFLQHKKLFKLMSLDSTKFSPIPSIDADSVRQTKEKQRRDARNILLHPQHHKNFPLLTHKLTHRESYLVSMAMKKSPSHSVAGGGRKRFGDVWKEFEWGFAIKNGFMEVVHLKVFLFGKKHVQIIGGGEELQVPE